MKKTYYIPDELKGKVFYTKPPDYKRKDGGKFVLDDNLSQKDLSYLAEELNYPLKVDKKENKEGGQ